MTSGVNFYSCTVLLFWPSLKHLNIHTSAPTSRTCAKTLNLTMNRFTLFATIAEFAQRRNARWWHWPLNTQCFKHKILYFTFSLTLAMLSLWSCALSEQLSAIFHTHFLFLFQATGSWRAICVDFSSRIAASASTSGVTTRSAIVTHWPQSRKTCGSSLQN